MGFICLLLTTSIWTFIWKRIRVELARLGYDAWVYVDRKIFAAYHDLPVTDSVYAKIDKYYEEMYSDVSIQLEHGKSFLAET